MKRFVVTSLPLTSCGIWGRVMETQSFSVLCKIMIGIVPNSLTGLLPGSNENKSVVFPTYSRCCFSHSHSCHSFAYLFSATNLFPTPEPCSHLPFAESFPDVAWMPAPLLMPCWPLHHQNVCLFIGLHMYLYYPFTQLPITICNFFLDYILSKVH